MDEIQLTIEEMEANILEMNEGNMHEVDQLVIMCDTQRTIIRMLQEEIKVLKSNR